MQLCPIAEPLQDIGVTLHPHFCLFFAHSCHQDRFMPEANAHPNDPLHGITLETVLTRMVKSHGWERLADQIQIRCFMFDPTINSSLTFLRKNPWARKKLEDWYVYDATRGWIDPSCL